MEVKEIVSSGYNKIAESYYANRDLNKFERELEKFIKMLPENAHVLDAGCGAGIPTAKFLTERGLKVTGIDISKKMLELASKNVPLGNFLQMDMNDINFEPNVFDGIISVYSLFHIPKRKHASIYEKFYTVLKPGGKLLINTGINDSEGLSDFFGVPMFWSNLDPKKTLEVIKNVGFDIDFEGVLMRGGEFQYWIYATKF